MNVLATNIIGSSLAQLFYFSLSLQCCVQLRLLVLVLCVLPIGDC